jgi:acyl-coenzyme A thioesterase PaaI-like protein
MNEKSVRATAFYRPAGTSDDGGDRFDSLPSTAGPWSPDAQHGGPPAALLGRAVEAVSGPGTTVGRLTMELLGPVPMGPLRTSARITRPGRSVQLVEAELYDEERGRPVAVSRAWLFPEASGGPFLGVAETPPLTHGPADGVTRGRPESWHGGYLDAIDWRWIKGGVDETGPGVVWMRSPALVEGEEISPLQRLLACVDSASGASASLDVREWAFLNTELTVHVFRPPVGEWVCLDAETTVAGGSVGVATSTVWDEHGLVARSTQALLVVRR